MKINWSRYRDLPTPPEIPLWRDFRIKQAFRNRYNQLKRKYSLNFQFFCISYAILTFLLFAFIIIFDQRCRKLACSLFVFVELSLILLPIFLLLWYLANQFRIWFHSIRLIRKFGMVPFQQKRQDISRTLHKLLAERQKLDEEEFRHLWPTERQAFVAGKLVELARRCWYFHNRMLYPNDPLLLFFFGKEFKWGKNKMILPDEFMAEVSVEFNCTLPENMNLNIPFAELVERCTDSLNSKERHQIRTHR